MTECKIQLFNPLLAVAIIVVLLAMMHTVQKILAIPSQQQQAEARSREQAESARLDARSSPRLFIRFKDIIIVCTHLLYWHSITKCSEVSTTSRTDSG